MRHFYLENSDLWKCFKNPQIRSFCNECSVKNIYWWGRMSHVFKILWGNAVKLWDKWWKHWETGPEVIKLFSCSTQLSTKFILFINVKMPTIVGILTFISLITTTSARNVYFPHTLVVMSSWNFMLSWVEYEKGFITSGPDTNCFIQCPIGL